MSQEGDCCKGNGPPLLTFYDIINQWSAAFGHSVMGPGRRDSFNPAAFCQKSEDFPEPTQTQNKNSI